MRKPTAAPAPYVQPYRYPSPNIPLAAIRRFARRIAKQFQPRKIILFGSYAYGKPHAESDVDLLVVMPASDVVNMAIRISLAFERLFSFDLIVRTPEQMERGVKDNDWFLRRSWKKERSCMKRKTLTWVRKAEDDWDAACELAARSPPLRDAVCFHCQQAAEKYLKALLQEKGGAIPKTHDLEDLLDLLLPHDGTIGAVSAGLECAHQIRRRIPLPRRACDDQTDEGGSSPSRAHSQRNSHAAWPVVLKPLAC